MMCQHSAVAAAAKTRRFESMETTSENNNATSHLPRPPASTLSVTSSLSSSSSLVSRREGDVNVVKETAGFILRAARIVRFFLLASLAVTGGLTTCNVAVMFLEFPHTTTTEPKRKWNANATNDGIAMANATAMSTDVYVPGAGFSGFFYTLGRLQSDLHPLRRQNQRSGSQSVLQHGGPVVEDALSSSLHSPPISHPPPPYEYHCFSAGCLAVLTALLRIPVDDALHFAVDSRERWMRGEIGRYDVVGAFVDRLLERAVVLNGDGGDANHCMSPPYRANATISKNATATKSSEELAQINTDDDEVLWPWLSRINILTTTWDGSLSPAGVFCDSRRPRNSRELKTMLIQTTWIPFVTGPSLFAPQDASTGLYHNDGAFTGLLHTRCARVTIGDDDYHNSNHDDSIENKFGAIRRLLLPLKWDLVSNALNIFLGYDRAVEFWNQGYLRGM